MYLSGKAQQSFAQVDVSALDDYDLVKSTMLESLGDTPSSADRRWWSLCRRSGEEAGTFYLRIRSTGLRRLDGLVTKEEVCEKVILSRFLSLLAPDCYNCVIARQPQTGLEAAKLVQEYEEARTFARRQQPWKHASHQNNQHYRREQGTGGGVSTGGGVPTGGGVSSSGGVSSGSGSSQNGSVSSVVATKPVGRSISKEISRQETGSLSRAMGVGSQATSGLIVLTRLGGYLLGKLCHKCLWMDFWLV